MVVHFWAGHLATSWHERVWETVIYINDSDRVVCANLLANAAFGLFLTGKCGLLSTDHIRFPYPLVFALHGMDQSDCKFPRF